MCSVAPTKQSGKRPADINANPHIDAAIGLRPLVREHADEAERERHLPRPVAEAFAREGLYRVAAPTEFHGADADPMTQIGVIEAVSRADGSAGWNLMIGIETFGLIAPGFAHCPELIEDPMTIMASSTAAVGRADREDGGWRVSGQWQFVSGIHNAELFGATVRRYANDEPVLRGSKRVSRPGLRVYTRAREIPRVMGGIGVALVSTSSGLMTGSEARRRRLGGEVLAFVW